MQIRLTHVLSGMALILLAGLAAVAVLERRAGGARVPGIVVLDLPDLGAEALGRLAAEQPGARVIWAPADDRPLAPFVPEILERHRGQGYHATLLGPGGRQPEGGDWDLRTRPESYRVMASQTLTDLVQDDLGLQIRSQRGTRPFVLAVVSEPVDEPRLGRLLTEVGRELDALPSYRRSSLVVLGERRDGRRLALRRDLGHWIGAPPDDLADLLEPSW